MTRHLRHPSRTGCSHRVWVSGISGRGHPGWPGMLALLVPLLAALSPGAQAADWSVPGPGLPTVAAAVARAKPGDRIRIAPGVYRERLVLSKALVLEAVVVPATGGAAGTAADAAYPVLDGGGIGHVLEIRSPGVVVRGLAVRNSGDTLGQSDACIYVHGEATGTRLLGNRLEDCAFGIWVNGTAGVEVAHNRIRGRPRPIVSDRGNGINLWQIRHGRIHDNDIAQTRDGVYLSVTRDSEVVNNRMHDLRFGVHYMYSDQNRVAGNIICDSQVGLALMFSKRLEIRGNAAVRN